MCAPRLLVHGIVDGSQKQYFRSMKRFFEWLDKRTTRLDTSTPSALDRAMTWFMEKRYFKDRKGHQEGMDLRSGLVHVMPELGGNLPLSLRASQTWRRLDGNREREPLCREGAARMIRAIARQDQLMGWCAWAQYDSLMREQDVQALDPVDISVGKPSVALELGVLSRGESTKTGLRRAW